MQYPHPRASTVGWSEFPTCGGIERHRSEVFFWPGVLEKFTHNVTCRIDEHAYYDGETAADLPEDLLGYLRNKFD